MSYDSVFQSVAPLLMAGIPGLVTVADAADIPETWVPQNLCPAVLLSDRPIGSGEVPLAIGASDRCWWLDCALWSYWPAGNGDLLTDPSLVGFRQMREQLQAVLRGNAIFAGGRADDATFNEKVYASGRVLQAPKPPPVLVAPFGQVVRRCTVSVLIREAVFFSVV